MLDFLNKPFFQQEFLGNTFEQYVIALSVFIAIRLLIALFLRVILKKMRTIAERTATKIDDKVVEILENISGTFYAYISFYLMLKVLRLHTGVEQLLDGVFILLAVVEVVKVVQALIDYGFHRTERKFHETSLHGLKLIARILLWSIGVLLILSNLGFNITTLAASMGIGGIAVALAAQNILGDLFASFTIYFDKPFELGDFIVIGTEKGVVQKIGLKTTRLLTLQGEELVMSNRELTESRIQNFKKMQRRRIPTSVGVVYGTPLEKLKKIPTILTDIINQQELAECDRVHFREFNDWSLDFEFVYYINSQLYHDYMDTRQAINFAIVEAFEKEGIEMAFPTRTVHLEGLKT